MKKLVIIVIVVAGMLLMPAAASARTPSLASLAKTVAALKKQVKSQATTIKSLKTKLANGQSVLALAPYVSLTQTTLDGVKGPNIVFKGVNVHIRSALGETDTSGLGNLIVGWDENPSSTPAGYRSGSNYLVCGDMNSFMGCGGFVAGEQNVCSVAFNSVSGGFGNVADGWWYSSVSGGDNNHASGSYSSISGGTNNQASGSCSSISGGHDITESAANGWAAGVYENH